MGRWEAGWQSNGSAAASRRASVIPLLKSDDVRRLRVVLPHGIAAIAGITRPLTPFEHSVGAMTLWLCGRGQGWNPTTWRLSTGFCVFASETQSLPGNITSGNLSVPAELELLGQIRAAQSAGPARVADTEAAAIAQDTGAPAGDAGQFPRAKSRWSERCLCS